jgi:hypothetical protein
MSVFALLNQYENKNKNRRLEVPVNTSWLLEKS